MRINLIAMGLIVAVMLGVTGCSGGKRRKNWQRERSYA